MLHPWQFVFDPEWSVAIVIVAVDYALVVWAARRTGRRVPLGDGLRSPQDWR